MPNSPPDPRHETTMGPSSWLLGCACALILWAGVPAKNVFMQRGTDEQYPISLARCCRPGADWNASDETGQHVASGFVSANYTADLPAAQASVGFYRVVCTCEGATNATNATTAAVLRPPHPSAPEWPPRHTPIAADTAQAWLQPCDLPTQLEVSRLAAQAGCGWTRDRLRWSDLEPQRGVYAPPNTCYDNATTAAATNGVKVLEVFHAVPAWAINASADVADGCDASGANMPRDLLDLHRFTAYLPRRFGPGRVAAYEPWNEGNIGAFGGQSTDQRASHQKAAFLGFKSAAPDAPFVCNNVIAGAGSNITATLTAGNDVAASFQSYNIHSYLQLEQYPSAFLPGRLAAGAAPLWLTECGIHLNAATPPPWSDMTPGDDQRQAAFLAPSYAVSFFAGVKVHFFFVLSNYLERGVQFGLLRYDRTPRPGFSALAAVGHFLANATALGRIVAPAGGGLGGSRPAAEAVSPAAAYAHSARPGGGARRDVLVAYCPEPATACPPPPALLRPEVLGNATVYDYLGRALPAGLPATLAGPGVFVVLPAGFAGQHLPLEPPLRATPRDRPTTASGPSRAHHPRASGGAPSRVVLQGEFRYDQNDLGADDSHMVDGAGRNTTFYVYNFGDRPTAGSVSFAGVGGAEVVPSLFGGVTVAAGQRARLVARVIPPTRGRHRWGTVPGAGTVTAAGSFDGAAPAVLQFRVRADPATLTPAGQVPCAGATDSEAWVPNIAHGGRVDASAADGCVSFRFTFSAATTDAWAYPQLVFNATTAPTPAIDGIRYSVQAVGVSAGAKVKQMDVIFFTRNGTQYNVQTRANPADPRPQNMTVLLQDATWGGFGPTPTLPLNASMIVKMAVGLNLDRASSAANMTVCGLRWVRF